MPRNAKERADELQEQLDAIEDKPAEVRELTEEELEEIRDEIRAENARSGQGGENAPALLRKSWTR